MLVAGLAQSPPDVVGGGPVAFVVTLLVTLVVAWAFSAFTLHLAATFFIGDVPTQPAAAAAIAPAITAVLVSAYPPAVIIALTLAVDAIAIRWAYGLRPVGTIAVTLLHFAFTAVLAIALNNLFGFV